MIAFVVIAAPVVGIVLVQTTQGAPNEVVLAEGQAAVPGDPALHQFQLYPKTVAQFEVVAEPSEFPLIEAAVERAFDGVYNNFQEAIRKQVSLDPSLAAVSITGWHFHDSSGAVDQVERPETDTFIFARPLTLNANSPSIQGIPFQIAGAPSGVAGYILTISFDPGVVAIQSVAFPPLGLSDLTILSPHQAIVSFVDLNNQISGGSTFENLFIMEVTSVAEGVSTIDIEITQLDDSAGSPMRPRIIQGIVEVR